MGHARSYVVFDVLRRYLEYRGWRVRHVQNYTDLEDSISRRARDAGEEPLAYAGKRLEAFRRDMDHLGIRPAHAYPRVTEHIPEIVAVVGAPVPLVGPALRDDALDFALWKPAKPGEPSWDSPWGRGRPGWHVECFAMGSKHLGDQVDLHGGGTDLIYPHHESEEMIAEAITGKVWSRFWLHNGFLLLENAKMSKSLGNAAPLAPYLEEQGPDVLRLCLIKEYYRDSVEHDPVCFRISAEQVAGLRKAWEKVQRMGNGPASGKVEALVKHSQGRFVAAMDDDLNTTDAVVAVIEFAEAVKELPVTSAEEARTLADTFRGFLGVLGLFGL